MGRFPPRGIKIVPPRKYPKILLTELRPNAAKGRPLLCECCDDPARHRVTIEWDKWRNTNAVYQLCKHHAKQASCDPDSIEDAVKTFIKRKIGR